MCGIVGVVGPLAADPDGPIAGAWLTDAVRGLHHRGPDGHGIWRAPGVALGHTRLAIIDLSETGFQPMHSACGGHVLTYNGEVYGTAPLAAPLLADGWRPRGHSDTEIVLEHLRRNGPAGLADLNGMFGLALWNRAERTVLLARDRVGIKPLYYAQIGASVAFSSELSALAKLPGVDRRLDREALALYLGLGVVPAPWTMLRGVRQLEPGTFISARVGAPGVTLVPRPYCPRIGAVAEPQSLDPREQDRLLEQLVLDSVRDQLVADVPVGVLLSGGVDSSVVAAAAARCTDRLRTFSVVHKDPAFDERHAARMVAKHLGTEHVEIELRADGMTRDELDQLVEHHGDPFADSSSLPTRLLANIVRQHVTVALSGDGGDEVFAGYDRYWQNQLVEHARSLPRTLRSPLQRAGRALTGAVPDGRVRGLIRRAGRVLSLAERSAAERAVGTITMFWPDEQQSLLTPDFRANRDTLGRAVQRCAVAGPSIGSVDGCHRLELHLNLPDRMLVKVDRMTMAESLEIRPPLLDNRILAFAAGLPIARKRRGKQTKMILRELARRWVPPEAIDRPKKGFALPLYDYGGEVFTDATRWSLSSAESPLTTLFTDDARARLTGEFQRRGEGVDPEDSAYRRQQRQWTIAVLGLALRNLGVELG